MVPLFDAVLYCHELGIVHRDIKPENLLFDKKNIEEATIKIADFGLARYTSEEVMASTTCGTPGYVAPEILKKTSYDYRCDYWSMGVVMFILLSGTPPFYHEDNFELFEIIKKGRYSFRSSVWRDVSEEARDFISKLLQVNPDDRITKEEIRCHPWITGDFNKENTLNVLNQMREWNTQRKLPRDI